MKKLITLLSAVTVAVSVLLAVACSGSSDDVASTPDDVSRSGAIEGIVTGIDGQPATGMRVSIVSGTASFPEIAPETDEEGRYRIGGVPPGVFEVAAHDSEGQRVGMGSVTVTSGETAMLDLFVTALVGGVPSPTSAKSPTASLCLPAVALAVSVGDSWTISGTVNDPEGIATELPEGTVEVSSTFTIDAIETTTYSAGRGSERIEHPRLQITVTSVNRDEDGNILSTEDQQTSSTPSSVNNLGPALTPDWECHEKAWLDGWPAAAQPSVGERALSSGVTAVVFSVRQPLLVPELGIDAMMERHHGYDRLTGRVVLQVARATGTRNGEPFNMELLGELAPAE